MAGGRGSRMGPKMEKPLIDVYERTMLELVVDALDGASGIEEVAVATSPHTPKTKEMARRLGLKVIETQGHNYVEDAQVAIRTLIPRIVLVISADLPQVSSRLIDKIITHYHRCGKPSLKVVTSVMSYEREGANESKRLDENRSMRAVGINIIDSRHIDEPQIDETTFSVDTREIGINVNRPEDLKILFGKKLGSMYDAKANPRDACDDTS
jgi:adenosylcobinamide-phosphate guanylyltransferase